MPDPRPAGAPRRYRDVAELLAGATERTVLAEVPGKSGASLEQVVIGGERYILKHLSRDRRVTSGREVRVAQHQQKLPVRSCIRRTRIVHPGERKPRRQSAIHEWNQRPLPERFHFLLRRVRNQHRIMIHGICERAARRAELVICVRVGEKQPFAARSGRSNSRGMVLTDPSGGQPFSRQHS